MARKLCGRCGKLKLTKFFSACAAKKDGLQTECKRCRRERRLADPERARQYVSDAKDRNRAALRASSRRYMFLRNLSKLYGMTEDSYEAMLAAQGNRCAVCSNLFTATPHVDHSHKTGKVRGLLCGGCNTGLGLFKDNPDVLRAAVRYLARNAD